MRARAGTLMPGSASAADSGVQVPPLGGQVRRIACAISKLCARAVETEAQGIFFVSEARSSWRQGGGPEEDAPLPGAVVDKSGWQGPQERTEPKTPSQTSVV
ncbi:hypothetical protein Y1Q_0012962 [Alligator mississippiensis]|uniref:Uncharacterized protein n=1 Tax=Alligator mississippiensis TaxID=8496 RepID=A0A151NT09_ALLMI|nr:hypothetical protein Y1Q_0012962 [Alligator mississippiensis]